jgi:hypothetical protein
VSREAPATPRPTREAVRERGELFLQPRPRTYRVRRSRPPTRERGEEVERADGSASLRPPLEHIAVRHALAWLGERRIGVRTRCYTGPVSCGQRRRDQHRLRWAATAMAPAPVTRALSAPTTSRPASSRTSSTNTPSPSCSSATPRSSAADPPNNSPGDAAHFAACVAHELRAPISLQRALVEVALADPHATTVALRAMGERVIASCEHQQRLIEALLDLARSQCGLNRHEPVDIAAITNSALRAHDLSQFESVVTLEPARTTGDPDLVERLAANLISNATRHNVTGGRIEVATRTDADRAVLSVTNAGQLIPAGELTRLFQHFERLGSQADSRADGTGLGLSIVQAIASAHDASITVHPPADGGLQIAVSFPATICTNYPRNCELLPMTTSALSARSPFRKNIVRTNVPRDASDASWHALKTARFCGLGRHLTPQS